MIPIRTSRILKRKRGVERDLSVEKDEGGEDIERSYQVRQLRLAGTHESAPQREMLSFNLVRYRIKLKPWHYIEKANRVRTSPGGTNYGLS
jgi:hypothetical protein